MYKKLVRCLALFSVLAVTAVGAYLVGVRRGCETAKIDFFGEGFIAGERYQKVLDIPQRLSLYDRLSKLTSGIEDERWKYSGLPKNFFDRLKASIAVGMNADGITAADVLNESDASEEEREEILKILSSAEESASQFFLKL